MEIQFQSRWFEKCIRDYLGIADGKITTEDVSVIKYLYVSTTDGYFLGFGKGDLPANFEFSDAGDEWFCCCLSDTGKYRTVEEFIDIREWEDSKELQIKSELLDEEREDKDASDMKDFESSVKIYESEENDFDGLVRNEMTYDYGILYPEDFVHLKNLEVVRLMSCETEIHSLAFLESLSKIHVLEVGQVRLHTLEGLDKMIGLEKLCIWAN